MFLINGMEQNYLAADDRAIQFGDGCFTTARLRHGEIDFFAEHLHRLRTHCQALMIPFDEWELLSVEMRQRAYQQQNGVLKVIITRGSGGRGYNPVGCQPPSRIISCSSAPAHYPHWQRNGISLNLSPIRLGRNAHLAGLKHLNRLEQVLIRMHIEQTGADEALVLDSEGWVTECCAANLFWRVGDKVFTPRLNHAGVNGIMRQHCLAVLAQSHVDVVEINAREEAVLHADEVVLCNALMPVVPVKTFGNTHYRSRELFEFLAPRCEYSMTS